MTNIILIGFRCAGKSTVGKLVADRLRQIFIDCDDYIEQKTHLTIREIFDIAGETHFRRLEGDAISELSKLDRKVIATGGGAALRYRNIRNLKRQGIIIFLEVAADTAFDRLRRDPAGVRRRPPLTQHDPLTEMKKQVEFRRPYYLGAADLVVKTDSRPVIDVVEEIMKYLRERGFPDYGEDRDMAHA
ncbi:MAG: shikimate kinase [Planctomycetes bacterium]|nr:shikimate kinase [Planctomycetota bacterium]